MSLPVRPLTVSLDTASTLGEDGRALLGAKAAWLADLRAAGVPVPDGFALTTDAFDRYRDVGWDPQLDEVLRTELAALEARTGRRLGGSPPLLVSVRSGATSSMPGMLSTVLNVAVTGETRTALAAEGGVRFADDTLERAHRQWDDVVGGDRPDGAVEQVVAAVTAVFDSVDGIRARAYRARDGQRADRERDATAVTVQAMVFGNRDAGSGSGALASRDPTTGASGVVGDVSVGGQGPDVMGGTSPTVPLGNLVALEDPWPRLSHDVTAWAERIERLAVDMVDIEFTVDAGALWILQVRPSVRSTAAALRCAVDQAEDDRFPLTRRAAVSRVAHVLDRAVPVEETGVLSDDASEPVARGRSASPGRAVGMLVTDPLRALELAAEDTDVILARPETSPADVEAIGACAGLFTTRGGLVSHAAVVARDWGIPAVVGAVEATVDADGITAPGGRVRVGELVTVDADRGALWAGTHRPTMNVDHGVVETLRRWRHSPDGDSEI